MDTATRNLVVDDAVPPIAEGLGQADDPSAAAAHTNSASDSAQANAAEPADAALLIERHQTEIWRYLRYLGCDAAGAEDVAQETFMIVLAKPPADLGPAALRSYLRKVARSQFLLAIRKSQRRWAEVDVELAEEVWREMHPDDGGEEYLAALDGCLQQLDGRAKSAIDLAYREGRSRAEMASLLEMSEDGVKSLLRRTRDVLRQCIERKTRP
jgi:RNA polymerase sigma-70 factor (ECF subfamily)